MTREPDLRNAEDVSARSAEVTPDATVPQQGMGAATSPVRPVVPTRKSVAREYAEAIIVAMLLAFAIRVFVVQAFKIPSGSMIPTLLIGDHILVSKLTYGIQWPSDCRFQVAFPPVNCYASYALIEFGKPQRGDIIVFRFP